MSHPDDSRPDWSLDEKRAAQVGLIETISTRATGPEEAAGDTPEWFGPAVFGGFVVGQTLHAASTTVEDRDRRPHSLHAYFLRPVVANERVTYRVTRLRDGRAFSLRRVDAYQRAELVCTMSCSFTRDTNGYEYELRVAEPPSPADAYPLGGGPGPWLVREVGPSAPAEDGTRASTRRAWMRLPDPLPDDPMLHAAIVAMTTDMTGTGGRPLDLDGGVDGLVSLDHAVWFHRPLRPDDWCYYDVHALVNTGGRGTLRATMRDHDGRLAVSVAQEMLLRVL